MTLRDQLKAGLIAGIVAGVTLDLFLFATQLASGTPPGRLADNFVVIAAVLLGQSAYANPAAVPLGIVVHFCVAIGWALGYVHVARSQSQLLTRPWVSGAVFGFVVYLFMGVVLVAAGHYHPTMTGSFALQIVALVVFYGLPVGLITRHLMRQVD